MQQVSDSQSFRSEQDPNMKVAMGVLIQRICKRYALDKPMRYEIDLKNSPQGVTKCNLKLRMSLGLSLHFTGEDRSPLVAFRKGLQRVEAILLSERAPFQEAVA